MIKIAPFIIMLAILGVVFGPIIGIWAINTLFPVAAIPVTLKTWFAVLLLLGLLKGSAGSSK